MVIVVKKSNPQSKPTSASIKDRAEGHLNHPLCIRLSSDIVENFWTCLSKEGAMNDSRVKLNQGINQCRIKVIHVFIYS